MRRAWAISFPLPVQRQRRRPQPRGHAALSLLDDHIGDVQVKFVTASGLLVARRVLLPADIALLGQIGQHRSTV